MIYALKYLDQLTVIVNATLTYVRDVLKKLNDEVKLFLLGPTNIYGLLFQKFIINDLNICLKARHYLGDRPKGTLVNRGRRNNK